MFRFLAVLEMTIRGSINETLQKIFCNNRDEIIRQSWRHLTTTFDRKTMHITFKIIEEKNNEIFLFHYCLGHQFFIVYFRRCQCSTVSYQPRARCACQAGKEGWENS
jgi:hypothetical protein